IAQLVEHNLAKVGVASSSLVSRSKFKISLFMIQLLSWQSTLSSPRNGRHEVIARAGGATTWLPVANLFPAPNFRFKISLIIIQLLS
ncbi:hypothetical protein, partial [Alteromonas lipotrueiana]|uniref:hypothetical protein n=1 Tax=Alteromonas lipotrueiana TaxID=2803815 RepID=UPI001C4947AA